MRFDALNSWTDSGDAEIRYFSGTATYRQTFRLDAFDPEARIVLDLGAVKNLAEVIVNSRNMGVAWKAPFRLDITEALQRGRNRLEVSVTNLWPNRLIGDKQPGAGPPQAWAAFDPYQASSPLLPSGLLGPVRLLARLNGAGASSPL